MVVGGVATGDAVPCAKVVPGEGRGYDADFFGFFHHGVVDADAGEGGEEVFGGMDFVLGDVSGDLPCCPGDVGLGLFEFGDERGEGEEEHSGVPEEPFGLDELLGRGEVGFFAEGRDFRGGALGFADFDVAESGLGPVGRDAYGDDRACLFGDGEGVFDRPLELGLWGDTLIGGEDGDGGIGPAFGVSGHDVGGDPDEASGGISFVGFGKDVGGGDLRAGLNGGGGEEFAGGDECVLGTDAMGGAFDGLGEEVGVWGGESEELFGPDCGADRPKALSGASGHDEGKSSLHMSMGECILRGWRCRVLWRFGVWWERGGVPFEGFCRRGFCGAGLGRDWLGLPPRHG